MVFGIGRDPGPDPDPGRDPGFRSRNRDPVRALPAGMSPMTCPPDILNT